jgi:ribosomal protein S19
MVISGRVAFDTEQKDANGKTVTKATVKTSPKQTLVSLTIWPDIVGGESIEKGDFVMAEGKYTANVSNGKTYHNLSVSDLFIGKPLPKGEREVVGGGAAAADAGDDDSPF